ncbi:KpsF/GutQ family sugar-phosphate isomerase [Pleomorphomonas oryzae]|uniref:KpsF/GutQ family sugar-phosphate isomerase n=1 Tax=Pleomorphomonas oryzae TaxID=261934 RepID=UPI000427392F|nr:SIS domain-containing protein [Pleomorphomonas oryzae]
MELEVTPILQRIRKVLQAEAEAINAIPVTDQFEAAVRAMCACEGKIVTTGIGKAGLVARKISATLCSTGTPSAFLHPGEAAHGDLGMLDHKDVLIAFSTSGKSVEVLETLEFARHLDVSLSIGITSHVDSGIRAYCPIVIDMGPVEESGCPLGLTPSSSTTVMMAIGDALALAVMEQKSITRHDYGLRHHGGYLGKRARTDNL